MATLAHDCGVAVIDLSAGDTVGIWVYRRCRRDLIRANCFYNPASQMSTARRFILSGISETRNQGDLRA